ncbi:conserved unknown protein [Ectocarpus siliculosus]|uniref:Thioredoxin domain-containing protein n=1 Tax=Ectocarpus siliculosus TaxID=2880 RepID=D7FR90_ECTSI|nr:conserved unknown protein [Ectocarpus siliculosus]|eukprot:CBJ49215.1 conserved unknown protein [Ectocarpus siliculosus]
MAPPIAIESEEHLQRLVQENDKLIAGWIPAGEDGEPTAEEAFEQLPADAEGGLALLCRIDPGIIPAANLLPDGWETSEGDQQEPCWFFYSAGKMVYAAQDSATPGPKLGRLAALLERSPDTLHQLARQDQVLRRQRRGQQASTATAAGADQGHVVVAAAPPQEPGRHGAARGEQLLGVTQGGAARERGVPASGPGPAVLVFVAGDRSQVGKSSTCLGLLGALLRREDLCSSDLAYIKPATQCEKPQLVTDWCEANGVACRGIGPVVFYKGFTRQFLKGGAGTSEELLQEIRDAVEEISSGKKVVVVDGVGYPAVGSICGVSNGDVAAALKAPVLLVGKSGVGDAVDSYNLNACFFEARGVRVLGGVFNRISTAGYYSLERCREAVTSYFAQANPNALPYGFVPEIASLKHAAETGSVAAKPGVSQAEANSTAVPPAPGAASAQAEVAQGEGGGPGSGMVTGLSDSPTRKGPEAALVKEKLPATEVEDEQDLQAFVATAGSERLVLVDFGAEWCKNCKAILPLVRNLPERFDGTVAVATADVDKAAELADEREVTTIPHFLLLKNGVQVDTYTGSSETDLLSKLAQHLPNVGSPSTEPSPAGSGSAGAGSSGAMIRSGPGEHAKGVNGEDVPGKNFAALKAAEALIDAFDGNVDVARLLRDIRQYAAEAYGGTSSKPSRRLLPPPPPLLPRAPGEAPIQKTKAAADSSSGQPWAVSAASAVVQQQQGATVEEGRGGEKRETSGSDSSVTATKPSAAAAGAAAVSATRKSRQEVEAEAAKLGASGG